MLVTVFCLDKLIVTTLGSMKCSPSRWLRDVNPEDIFIAMKTLNVKFYKGIKWKLQAYSIIFIRTTLFREKLSRHAECVGWEIYRLWLKRFHGTCIHNFGHPVVHRVTMWSASERNATNESNFLPILLIVSLNLLRRLSCHSHVIVISRLSCACHRGKQLDCRLQCGCWMDSKSNCR